MPRNPRKSSIVRKPIGKSVFPQMRSNKQVPSSQPQMRQLDRQMQDDIYGALQKAWNERGANHIPKEEFFKNQGSTPENLRKYIEGQKKYYDNINRAFNFQFPANFGILEEKLPQLDIQKIANSLKKTKEEAEAKKKGPLDNFLKGINTKGKKGEEAQQEKILRRRMASILQRDKYITSKERELPFKELKKIQKQKGFDDFFSKEDQRKLRAAEIEKNREKSLDRKIAQLSNQTLETNFLNLPLNPKTSEEQQNAANIKKYMQNVADNLKAARQEAARKFINKKMVARTYKPISRITDTEWDRIIKNAPNVDKSIKNSLKIMYQYRPNELFWVPGGEEIKQSPYNADLTQTLNILDSAFKTAKPTAQQIMGTHEKYDKQLWGLQQEEMDDFMKKQVSEDVVSKIINDLRARIANPDANLGDDYKKFKEKSDKESAAGPIVKKKGYDEGLQQVLTEGLQVLNNRIKGNLGNSKYKDFNDGLILARDLFLEKQKKIDEFKKDLFILENLSKIKEEKRNIEDKVRLRSFSVQRSKLFKNKLEDLNREDFDQTKNLPNILNKYLPEKDKIVFEVNPQEEMTIPSETPRQSRFGSPKQSNADVRNIFTVKKPKEVEEEETINTNYPKEETIKTNYPKEETIKTNYPKEETIKTNYPKEKTIKTNYPKEKTIKTNYPKEKITYDPDYEHPYERISKPDPYDTSDIYRYIREIQERKLKDFGEEAQEEKDDIEEMGEPISEESIKGYNKLYMEEAAKELQKRILPNLDYINVVKGLGKGSSLRAITKQSAYNDMQKRADKHFSDRGLEVEGENRNRRLAAMITQMKKKERDDDFMNNYVADLLKHKEMKEMTQLRNAGIHIGLGEIEDSEETKKKVEQALQAMSQTQNYKEKANIMNKTLQGLQNANMAPVVPGVSNIDVRNQAGHTAMTNTRASHIGNAVGNVGQNLSSDQGFWHYLGELMKTHKR